MSITRITPAPLAMMMDMLERGEFCWEEAGCVGVSVGEGFICAIASTDGVSDGWISGPIIGANVGYGVRVGVGPNTGVASIGSAPTLSRQTVSRPSRSTP